MITLPPRLATLLLACMAGGGLVSCTSDTRPDGNIFLSERSPRYGYGGTDQPRYKYGATENTTAEARGETRYLNQRRPSDTVPPEREASTDTSSGSDESTRDSEATETTEAPPRRLEPAPEQPEPTPEPKPKPPVTEDIPYATPVPGQEGKVYSPFHSGGYVDVSGMPSGSKARCPYTKKVFRVP
ncbi:MAG: hypothetical protein ACKV19_02835 [Verrucomicrobiales bacterium]